MAKRARELLKNGNGAGHDMVAFSSGIVVEMLPFPAALWQEINIRAFRDFPDPVPPKKQVKVVDGFEEVDNLDDPTYKAAVNETGQKRNELLLEAILDICPQIDLTPWESKIKRLEKYSDPFPEDPDDRRIEFLTRYVIRTKGDYEKLFVSAITQVLIDDPEVAERVSYFRGEMERATTPKTDAPGAS
jgi:hypothetical protein